MPNKPWPVRAGSGKFHYMKATSLYLTLLLQTFQVLMCLRWSQAFRNTLSTLRKRHMLAPRDAFFSVLQLQLCNTHAPTISISIHLSHNTIIIFLSYMAFLNHTQMMEGGTFTNFSQISWGKNRSCLHPAHGRQKRHGPQWTMFSQSMKKSPADLEPGSVTSFSATRCSAKKVLIQAVDWKADY